MRWRSGLHHRVGTRAAVLLLAPAVVGAPILAQQALDPAPVDTGAPVAGSPSGARSELGLNAAPQAAEAPHALRTAAPQPIDLPTVLRLAGINDLDLALVREAERRAKAVNDAATLRFFPWLSAGASYRKESGAAQQVGGQVISVDQRLYEHSVAANLQVDLGSAIFEKLAARQRQRAAGYDIDASRNDTALTVADAYFDLVNAVTAVDIAREAVRIAQDYENQLNRAYQAGLTNHSEVLRVGVRTQRDQVILRRAQAAVLSASAALATLLRLDPAVELEPTERVVSPATLVQIDTPLEDLLKQALADRPELRASAAMISAANQERIAAKYGPLIPSLTGQAIYGQLRGGANGALSDYMSAHDFAVGLSWRLGPGGLLDFSRTEAANSSLRRDRLSGERLHDDIAQQVVQAYVAARSGLDQIGIARRAVELAEQSLKLSEERKQFGVYAVLEVIQAQQDLTQARADYAQALTQYAKAQYSLAHATARIGG